MATETKTLADLAAVKGTEPQAAPVRTQKLDKLGRAYATGKRKKFLRRIPVDPMTGTSDWGKRSYQDAPDSKVWGGQCVYDIYTKSDAKGLDGSKYKDW